jgi:energy-converting hydrogenase Eha subunit G
MKVTKIGGLATALMVMVWVGGLSYAFFYPASWLGLLIYAPIGLPAYVFGVAVLFGVAASMSAARGKPFFTKGGDVA